MKKYGRKYKAIDRAVKEDGLRIILLLRLSPIIPFGINNYLCGCTDLSTFHFALGTFFGVLPGTTVYCYLGSLGKEVASSDGTTLIQRIIMGVSIVAGL
eukprot:UN29829